MGLTAAWAFGCALAWLLGALGANTDEVPDVATEGFRRIYAEVSIDCGPLAARVCDRILVQKGDTLSALAKHYLGAVERTKDIEAVNPGLKPEKLKEGELLWLPPKGPLGEGEVPLVPFTIGIEGCEPLGPGFRVILGLRYGVFAVMFVPLPALAEFQAARMRQEQSGKAEDLRKVAAKLHAIDVRAEGAVLGVREESKAVRATTKVIIQRGADDKLVSQPRIEYTDKDGKPVDPAQLTTDGKKKRTAMLVLLLALAGAGGLWLRRRANPRQVLAQWA